MSSIVVRGSLAAALAVSMGSMPVHAAPPAAPAAPSTSAASLVPRATDRSVVAALTRTTPAPVAVLARRGVVKTSASGPPVGDPPGAWTWSLAQEELVGPIGARPLRIVTDTGTVRVVLHANPADLGRALARREVLRPAPGGAAPTSAFAELAPGAVIEVLDTSADGRWLRVGFADPFRWKTKDVVTGWVPLASVGGEVTAHEFDHAPSSARRVADVMPGSPLLDAPGGRAMLSFPSSSGTGSVSRWDTVPLGPPVRGHVRVAWVGFCDARVRLVGWVAAHHVTVRENTGGGGGCGTGTGGPILWGTLERSPRESVGAGRWLLDPATGEVIGRVVRDAALARAADGRLHVGTKFGPVPVVVAPPGWSP